MDKDYIVCNFCMEFRKEKDVYNNGDLWKTYSMELELPLQVAPNVGDIIELGGFNWRADLKVVSRQFGATVLENEWKYYYNYELEEVRINTFKDLK